MNLHDRLDNRRRLNPESWLPSEYEIIKKASNIRQDLADIRKPLSRAIDTIVERMNDSSKKAPLTAEEQNVFQELYQTHHRRVYSICLRMTRDISEAEDLTQEIFVHLFRALGSFRGESAFTTWLHRLTVNHVLMHFRKCKRRVRTGRTTEDGEPQVQALADSHDDKRMSIVDRILLSEVIAKLPDGYREALVLHDIEGFEHKEIAEMRGRTEGTSKSQLHKARRMLRSLITQPAQDHVGLDSVLA